MAESEHIRILNGGVARWNEWRKNNPDIEPDLSGIDLSYDTDSDIEENIEEIAEDTDLSGINLSRANLEGTDLSRIRLVEADFHSSNLGGANLDYADLSYSSLVGARLPDVSLYGATLWQADLSKALLTNANCSKANLSGALLYKADLRSAKLVRVSLSKANLFGATFYESNLQGASLDMARLVNAIFDKANITESCLWETQRAGWSIKGVICESVYWDEERREKILYGPGEFERLFAEKIRIRLFYKEGITPLEIATLPGLIKYLEESCPGCGLRLVSISEDSGGAVVELAIEDANLNSPEQLKQLKAALEAEARRKVEYQRRALAEQETRLRLEGALKQSDMIIDKLILRPTIHHGDINMSDNYNISGQAGAVGPNAHAHDMVFNQIVHQVEQSVDLAALAKELAELRQAIMEKRDSSPQAAVALGEIAKAEIAAQEKNGSTLVEHLKAAGQWALDFAKEIGKDLVVETIKQSMGMK